MIKNFGKIFLFCMLFFTAASSEAQMEAVDNAELKTQMEAARNAELHLQNGNTCMDGNKFHEAVEEYSKALKHGNKVASSIAEDILHFKRAVAYALLGEYDKAFRDLAIGRSFQIDFPGRYSNGLSNHLNREYEQAIENYTYLIQQNPYEFFTALYWRAHVYFSTGKLKEAMSDLDNVIALNPDFCLTYNLRGMILHSMGAYEEALSNYNKAISLAPSFEQVYANRGFIYHQMGKPDLALSDYNKAIDLKSNFTEIYNLRGNLYASKGQFELAISDMNRALDSGYKFVSHAYLLKANSYGTMRDFKSAMNNFNKAIETGFDFKSEYLTEEDVTPANFGMYHTVYFNRRLSQQESGLSLSRAYYGRGFCYFHIKKYDQALSDLNKSLKLDKKNAEAYYYRARIYVNKKKYNEAIADFISACELQPGNAEYLNGFAWLLATCPEEIHRKGPAAIEICERILQVTENASVLDTLAAAYAEVGRFDDAVMTQEKAVSLLKDKGYSGKDIEEYKEHLDSYKANKPWRENGANEIIS